MPDAEHRFCSRRATELQQAEGFAHTVTARRLQRERLHAQAKREFAELSEDDPRRTNEYWGSTDIERYESILRTDFERYLDYISNGQEDVILYKLLLDCEQRAEKLGLTQVRKEINNIRYLMGDR